MNKYKMLNGEDILSIERDMVKRIVTKYIVSDEYDQDTAIAQIDAVLKYTEMLLMPREVTEE